ncbi:hypothetical protein ABPG75_003051 [Micractinium tetrahymenae]
MPLGFGLEAHPAGSDDDGDSDSGGGAASLSSNDGGSSGPGLGRRRRKRRCRLVESVEVSVTSSDQSLNLETRESYSLEVAESAAMIQANSVYGALRGMETLAQLARRRELRCAPAAVGAGSGDGGGGEPGGSGEAGAGEGGGCTAEGRLVPPEAVWPADEEEDEGDWAAAADVDRHRRKKKRHSTVLLIEETSIYDAPRFRYRGLLLDTARHFLPVSVIKTHLDAMTMVKMNCLHWHITDDESFPWQLEEIPELSERGAFAPEAVYTAADIKEVVEYARFRGIRVIPELDTPGHTQSWGKSFPSLLTECFNTNGESTGRLGPINPARNESYGFMWRLLREAARHFPDPYLHLGGDEVDHECWRSNPEVQEFMSAKGFGSNFAKLEGYWMEQLVHLAATAGKGPIVWQEAFDQGDHLPAYARVQVWKWWKDSAQQERAAAVEAAASAGSGGDKGAAALSRSGEGQGWQGLSAAQRRMMEAEQAAAQQAEQQQRRQGASCDPGRGCAATAEDEAWKDELATITKAGYDAILSAPWYLNLGCYATQDWQKYYAADPHDFKGSMEQRDHVLGGEACAWGEFIDAVNSVNRVWPRAAAVAERLWSPADVTDVQDAAVRLADVRCRMLSRGVAAQSMGPGFCPGELTTRM